MEDLGKEVDEYFAKKYPSETKKVLCHKCGGAVDNSLQQLKAEIAAIAKDIVDAHNHMWEEKFIGCIQRLRQLSAV